MLELNELPLVLLNGYNNTFQKRKTTTRSVMLPRETVALVRSMFPELKLSSFILKAYHEWVKYEKRYNYVILHEFREKISLIYGNHTYYITSLPLKAVSILKEIKGKFGLRDIADAFDVIASMYIWLLCKDKSFSDRYLICQHKDIIRRRLGR